ncbi:MAG: DNA-primase RepB domain-containing protein [Caldilineaceae bacterium]
MTQSASIHPTNETQLRTNTERLLALLHRGGQYAHLWTDAGHRSYWFPVARPLQVNATESSGVQAEQTTPLVARSASRRNQLLRSKRRTAKSRAVSPQKIPRRVPKQWLRQNVYFSVHPLAQIPPHNTTGNTDQRFISSQSDYICAVNALFAEFDGKDYVYALEYRSLLPAAMNDASHAQQQQWIKAAKEELFYRTPARFKRRALHHIESLYYPPSVIVDSGGGYHCYWLLRETVPLDDANRDDVQVIQHGWVQMVGGDSGAADLRRVLRLPGTYNRKAGFGTASPRVDFVKADLGLFYSYTQLEEVVSDWLFARHRRFAARRRVPTGETLPQRDPVQNDLRQQFNHQHRIVDLLRSHGYRLCFERQGHSRLARPGRDRLHSSITVFPAQSMDLPERSIHFSTNDPLYSREFVDTDSGCGAI